MERLQKYLSRAGVASRRHAEDLIVDGRVKVNGKVVTELGSRVDAAKDLVLLDGKLVSPNAERKYFLFYKPPGVVTTLSDPEGRPTVGDYAQDTGGRVFPVGRLDYDAEGALILTDDGELANKLMHPSHQVPRVYLAKVKGVPDGESLQKLVGGVRLEDGMAHAVEARIFREADRNTWVKIVVTEGRQHLVKRLCAAIGHPVVRLYRPAHASISVAGLRPGELRALTHDEIRRVKAAADGDQQPEPPLKMPARRHGHAAPGFEPVDEDEGDEREERDSREPRSSRSKEDAPPAEDTFARPRSARAKSAESEEKGLERREPASVATRERTPRPGTEGVVKKERVPGAFGLKRKSAPRDGGARSRGTSGEARAGGFGRTSRFSPRPPSRDGGGFGRDSGESRGGERGGSESRGGARGGFESRSGARGGFESRGGDRGGSESRGGGESRGGFESRGGERGGSESRGGARGGFGRDVSERGGESRGGARGGFGRDGGARGGGESRGGSRGGFGRDSGESRGGESRGGESRGGGARGGFGKRDGGESRGGFGKRDGGESRGGGVGKRDGGAARGGFGKRDGGESRGGFGKRDGGAARGGFGKRDGGESRGGFGKRDGGESRGGFGKRDGGESRGGFGKRDGGESRGGFGKREGGESRGGPGKPRSGGFGGPRRFGAAKTRGGPGGFKGGRSGGGRQGAGRSSPRKPRGS